MYVPVLKWKMGEKKALEYLTEDVVKLISPLIELQPCQSLGDVKEMADKFGEEIEKAWKSTAPFYLDVSNIDEYCEDNIQYNEKHHIVGFIDKARSKSRPCIPVISYDNLEDYIPVIRAALPYLNDGIAIRIRKNAFLDADTVIPNHLKDMNIVSKKTDLIIDVREVNADDIPSMVISLKSVLPFANTFRKTILIGTGYPTDYPSAFMGAEQYKTVARTELLLWAILKQKCHLAKSPNVIYGDYCCSNSLPIPEDVSQMRPSAIIRYTTEDAWHIWRGIRLTRGGHQQYFELAEKVVNSPVYKDPTYSWGDKQMYLCSRRERTSGNPTTWVQITTNHHISLVARQFANPSGF